MSRRRCPREPGVVAAVRADAWDDALRRHLADCDACRQAAAVTSAMLELASADEAAPLPDPRLIWLRAQLARRRAADRKLRLMLAAMPAVGGLVALVLGAFAWQLLWPRLRDLAESVPLPAAGGDPSALLVLAATAAVLALLATWNHLLTSHR